MEAFPKTSKGITAYVIPYMKSNALVHRIGGRIGVNRWICLAYCSTSPSVATKPVHKGTAYTMTCDMLKVRKSPSTLSKQVDSYKRGEVFYVIAQKGNWCQLESGNWMCAGKYLKKV